MPYVLYLPYRKRLETDAQARAAGDRPVDGTFKFYTRNPNSPVPRSENFQFVPASYAARCRLPIVRPA